VAECILRAPFSLEKLRYQATTGTIIYQSKMHPTLKRNFEVFSATDWRAALTAHIPNAGEHLVRYYGWYSNVSRGKRRKAQGEGPATIEEFTEVSASAAKRAWARLIKQVYEADPLMCPRCTGPMRIIAFIEQPEVIEKILTHLGLWPAQSTARQPGYPLPYSLQRVALPPSQLTLAPAWPGAWGGTPVCSESPGADPARHPFPLTAVSGAPDTPPRPGDAAGQHS
jgi:hypothetical protein